MPEDLESREPASYFTDNSLLVVSSHAKGASLVPQMVKNLPAMQETMAQSLGREDPLEKEKTTLSSTAWKIPWTDESGRLQSMGWQRVRYNWACLPASHGGRRWRKELSGVSFNIRVLIHS